MKAATLPVPRLRRLTADWPEQDADVLLDALAEWWELLDPVHAVRYEAEWTGMGDMALRAYLRATMNQTRATPGAALAWVRLGGDARRSAGILLHVERVLNNPDREKLRADLEHLAGGQGA